nr:EAL domain-containing protein [Halanaerobacter jeridensis]
MIHNWLEEKKEDITIYSESEVMKNRKWIKRKDFLTDKLSKTSHEFAYFFVADKNGDYSTTQLKNAGNIKSKSYFKEAIQGKTYLSRPLRSPLTGEAIIIVTTPLKNESTKPSGILGGAIKLDQLTQYLSKFKVEHFNSYSYIIDKHGLVIAHPDKDIILEENILKASTGGQESLRSYFVEIKNNNSGYLKYQENDKSYYLFYNKILGSDGWKIITQIPNSYLKVPLMLVRRKLWVIALIAIIISAISSMIIANNISSPIIKLSDIFSQGAEGDLTVRANFNRNDEVGKAATSFNKMMDKISDLTYNDILTGLLTLSYFKDLLKLDLQEIKEKDKGQKVVLFSMGIDNYEIINDNFGHYVGNKVLKKIAYRIKHLVSKDIYIARSSNEFFLYWETTESTDKFEELAKKILAEINRKYEINGQVVHVTASLGIAVYPDSGTTSQRLIKNAGLAQHLVAENSSDEIQLYSSGMEEKLSERMRLEAKLKSALENKQFLLYYQPLVNAKTKEIESFEALLRWYHPIEGMISPSKFIPIIEDNGMIIEIGDWVLREACQALKKWHQQGYNNLSVSVNIAPQQFQSDNFLDDIKTILKEIDLEPQYLELEITERATMENLGHTIELLYDLKKLGVKISIDDFGTGYSSLSYLKEFAIDTLKIDKSFVTELTAQGQNNAIAETIVNMADSLKLNVTAEGVENKLQVEFLEQKKCDKLQGNYFSPAVPKIEVKELLQKAYKQSI